MGVKTTVQIVLDDTLLAEIDAAASKSAVNRSEFVRESLREKLHRLRSAELERMEKEGYERIPDDPEESRFWMEKAAWPDD